MNFWRPENPWNICPLSRSIYIAPLRCGDTFQQSTRRSPAASLLFYSQQLCSLKKIWSRLRLCECRYHHKLSPMPHQHLCLKNPSRQPNLTLKAPTHSLKKSKKSVQHGRLLMSHRVTVWHPFLPEQSSVIRTYLGFSIAVWKLKFSTVFTPVISLSF